MIAMILSILVFVYLTVEQLNNLFTLLVSLIELTGDDLTHMEVTLIVGKLKTSVILLTLYTFFLGITLASSYTIIYGVYKGTLKATTSKWGTVSYAPTATVSATDTINVKVGNK